MVKANEDRPMILDIESMDQDGLIHDNGREQIPGTSTLDTWYCMDNERDLQADAKENHWTRDKKPLADYWKNKYNKIL